MAQKIPTSLMDGPLWKYDIVIHCSYFFGRHLQTHDLIIYRAVGTGGQRSQVFPPSDF